MKCKAAAMALISLACLQIPSIAFAEVCYEASGTVTTENITSTLQMGTMILELSRDDNTVFNGQGSLVGNITGTDGYGATLLSHTARFSQGDSFVTTGDRAVLAEPYVRLYDDDGNLLLDEQGNPCSFWIHESITSIERGTRFFKDVTSVDVSADGYVSNCPTENRNFFELSGELCTE